MPKHKFILMIDGLAPYPIEFDARSFSWGDSPAVGSRFPPSSYSSMTKLWIVRPSDNWSSLMRQAAATGQSFDMSLTAQMEEQGRVVPITTYSFSEVFVATIQMSGNAPDIAENVGFNVFKFEVEYGSHQAVGHVD